MKNDKGRAACALEVGCCAARDFLRRGVGGLLMVSLIAAPDHGSAQIAALPSAAAMHRPQVLMTPNGVPMVNITAPSAAGVSRNLYQQFDVDRKGAILNNSRTGAQTNLGGAVGANPWLANGAARVILNEVRSNDPSLLRGPVEVAGQRAEVVIANPSGIQVDGGAFINASRATLTTGTPEVNALGGLERYVVRDGTITVDGAGLDLSRTDYGAILARAIKVNSAIWANYLQATGGANEIDAATGEAKPVEGKGERPQFRLDVALLGGMYAGKIFLNGTEHGLGVRNFGTLSSTGDLILTSDGKLVNKGTIEAAMQGFELDDSANGFTVRAQDVEHSHMHGMCAAGSSSQTCSRRVEQYRQSLWDLRSIDGLAGLLHLYQDEFAPGHANLHTYNGKVGFEHLRGDSMVPRAVEEEIVKGSSAIIEEYLRRCQCLVKK
ncbi:hypothetical protein VARIO8X_60393 [Burkholderiales bacterium 8X]|nr:hypothetical protein VARIO8X_60393 [Burkholderiales bacterium 8X]